MTREEVIQGLQFTIEMFLFDPSTGETLTEPRNNLDKATIDACKGAIELLKQQPCEDCISREEFERRIKPYDTEDKTDKALYNFAHNTLIGCPSVTPQPKRGHWIDQADSIGEYASGCYECDECHEVFWLESGTPQDNEHNFCPNCGADMREVQDER